MKCIIVTDDGNEYDWPDISYERFTELMFQSGSSDVEYRKYLNDNNMVEVTSFNEETTRELKVVITDDWSGKEIVFKLESYTE